jgi:hypothetical protein
LQDIARDQNQGLPAPFVIFGPDILDQGGEAGNAADLDRLIVLLDREGLEVAMEVVEEEDRDLLRRGSCPEVRGKGEEEEAGEE